MTNTLDQIEQLFEPTFPQIIDHGNTFTLEIPQSDQNIVRFEHFDERLEGMPYEELRHKLTSLDSRLGLQNKEVNAKTVNVQNNIITVKTDCDIYTFDYAQFEKLKANSEMNSENVTCKIYLPDRENRLIPIVLNGIEQIYDVFIPRQKFEKITRQTIDLNQPQNEISFIVDDIDKDKLIIGARPNYEETKEMISIDGTETLNSLLDQLISAVMDQDRNVHISIPQNSNHILDLVLPIGECLNLGKKLTSSKNIGKRYHIDGNSIPFVPLRTEYQRFLRGEGKWRFSLES